MKVVLQIVYMAFMMNVKEDIMLDFGEILLNYLTISQ
jgi:hypothetical protein